MAGELNRAPDGRRDGLGDVGERHRGAPARASQADDLLSSGQGSIVLTTDSGEQVEFVVYRTEAERDAAFAALSGEVVPIGPASDEFRLEHLEEDLDDAAHCSRRWSAPAGWTRSTRRRSSPPTSAIRCSAASTTWSRRAGAPAMPVLDPNGAPGAAILKLVAADGTSIEFYTYARLNPDDGFDPADGDHLEPRFAESAVGPGEP